MNENITKFEYYIFIKKIKEKIYVKNQMKTNIILFQKRSALDQLLINVIFKMKNDILNEKLKKLLIKKFFYKVRKNCKSNEKKEIYNAKQKNNKNESILLQNKKSIFNDFLFKTYASLFLSNIKICINNTRQLNIQNNYIEEKTKNEVKYYFKEIKRFKINQFQKETIIFYRKLFFIKIKSNLFIRSQIVKTKTKLNNTKRLFIYKINYHLFLKNIKSKDDKINILKQKIEKYKENKRKGKEIKYYAKEFINRVKISKQTNDSLKRKIFNILKTNMIISKDLKRYLNEAEKIN